MPHAGVLIVKHGVREGPALRHGRPRCEVQLKAILDRGVVETR